MSGEQPGSRTTIGGWGGSPGTAAAVPVARSGERAPGRPASGAGAVIDALAQGSADARVDVVAVPQDCSDGAGEAFVARPGARLQPEVRAATSGLILTNPETVQSGLERFLSTWEPTVAWGRRQAD